MMSSPGVLAAFAALAVATQGPEPVRGIRSEATSPNAVRGGVLVVPLSAGRPGDRWPQTLQVTFADGTRETGRIAWLEPGPLPAWSRWTVDPRGLRARWIEPTDDTSGTEPTGIPYLLARLPADGDGPIRLTDQTLEPIWHDVPRADHAGRPLGQLPLADHPGHPDRYSPFEYWRWVLLAARHGLEPPPPDAYGEPQALIATHYADLWRVGLGRLEALSPGVAAYCRDLLTQTCRDGELTFAAWVADPVQAGALLSLLIDRRRSDEAVRTAALAWADSQDLTLIWPEPTEGGQVRVAIANPTFEPMVARFLWSGDDEIPVAARLETGRVTRVDLDRPRPEAVTDPYSLPRIDAAQPSAPDVLLMDVEGRRERLVFAPTVIMARPPGVYVTPFRPALSLLVLQGRGGPAQVAPERATLAHVRRRLGRWEVFFECRRDGAPAPLTNLAACEDLADVRGSEAVTLLLGSSGRASVALVVPETGAWRLFAGPQGVAPEVHRRSYADRWYCRIVLPPQWLPDPINKESLEVGLVRSHQNSGDQESAPYAMLPWRLDPGRFAVDLSAW
jgi:hypothetical protein